MTDQPFISDFSEIHKIGIFRALYLGDMLCIVPAVRAVRKAFPSAHISLIGLPWQKEFVKRFPEYFDHFIEFPGWPGLPEQDAQADAIILFLKRMRAEHFDLVFQMHGNGFITNTLCSLWNARNVCGLTSVSQPIPDEGLFPISEDDDDHEILRFLKLTEALGLPSHGSELEFNFIGEELSNFRNMQTSLSLQSGKYVCIHAGARDERRRWSIDHFALVANHLCQLGHQVVLTGSVQEKELLLSLEKKIDYPVINIIQHFGDVGLGELAAFIKHSRMLISNDTGVSHIASALKVPSVIIFSPFSHVGRWAPLDTDRHLIILAEKSNHPEYVLGRTLDHLEKYAPMVTGSFQQ
jgi:ADP-heptose:LPS heptosyltransferase